MVLRYLFITYACRKGSLNTLNYMLLFFQEHLEPSKIAKIRILHLYMRLIQRIRLGIIISFYQFFDAFHDNRDDFHHGLSLICIFYYRNIRLKS